MLASLLRYNHSAVLVATAARICPLPSSRLRFPSLQVLPISTRLPHRPHLHPLLALSHRHRCQVKRVVSAISSRHVGLRNASFHACCGAVAPVHACTVCHTQPYKGHRQVQSRLLLFLWQPSAPLGLSCTLPDLVTVPATFYFHIPVAGPSLSGPSANSVVMVHKCTGESVALSFGIPFPSLADVRRALSLSAWGIPVKEPAVM